MSTLLSALEAVLPWLPHQGPLSGFVHANTLAGFEHLDFHEALAQAREVCGARVRLPEEDYRAMLADGRILESDLRAVFAAEPLPPDLATGQHLPEPRVLAWELLRRGLRETHWRIRAFRVAEGGEDPVVACLDPRCRAVLAEGARSWFSEDPQRAVEVITGTADKDLSLRRLREQFGVPGIREALRATMELDWRATEFGFALLSGLARRGLPPCRRVSASSSRVWDALQRQVDEILLPVVASFLDTGQAPVGPRLDTGLFNVGWQAIRRRRALRRHVEGCVREQPEATLTALRARLGAAAPSWQMLFRRLLLARPGWSGAVAWLESHRGAPRLLEYAALRLLLVVACAREEGLDPVALLTPPPAATTGPGTRADRVAQLLAGRGTGPREAERLAPTEWQALLRLLQSCDAAWRCRLLHEARERSARRIWLHALATRAALGPRKPGRPRAQFLCCLDEREESLRRALEESGAEQVETFGLAGHFNLALRWRSVDDVHGTPRHPVALASSHRVEEQALAVPGRLRRLVGGVGAWLDRAGSGLLGGALAGLLAGIPLFVLLAWRVLFPRRSEASLDRWRARWLSAPPSRLEPLRSGGGESSGLPLGFSVEEAAERVGDALELIGLRQGLAPLVVVVGHGSTSQNNPHGAAYNCGACGGYWGDGNARVFAALANAPEVREALARRGLQIPEQTVFVGAFHDTAEDALRLAEPKGLSAADEAWLRTLVAEACARDALERGRRFLNLPPEARECEARTHVEGRTRDLSQVRPECGHATNALLVVGSRDNTRDLFLDRRAFLHSYAPDSDNDGRGLARLLGAAVPVCAGINLEYYFSRVDPESFGAGTKLPHNVLGLFGVINGSLGDLRTGLPWQMVEIHEPTRLLVVVLAPRARVEAVIAQLDGVRQLVTGGWIQLSVIDATGTWVWYAGGFHHEPLPSAELRTAADSMRLCRGRRESIAPALLGETL